MVIKLGQNISSLCCIGVEMLYIAHKQNVVSFLFCLFKFSHDFLPFSFTPLEFGGEEIIWHGLFPGGLERRSTSLANTKANGKAAPSPGNAGAPRRPGQPREHSPQPGETRTEPGGSLAGVWAVRLGFVAF